MRSTSSTFLESWFPCLRLARSRNYPMLQNSVAKLSRVCRLRWPFFSFGRFSFCRENIWWCFRYPFLTFRLRRTGYWRQWRRSVEELDKAPQVLRGRR